MIGFVLRFRVPLATVLKIQNALEQAGIHFTNDEAGEIGVSLQKGNG